MVRPVGLAVALLTLAAAPVRAEGFIIPFYGYNFGGDSSNCESLSNCEDKRTNLGVSLGSRGPAFGFEADFAIAKDFFGKVPEGDNSVFSFMANLLIGPGVGPVQPYLLLGIGVIRPHSSLKVSEVAEFSKNALGYDIGGGVTGYFSRHVGIRGDIRRFRTLQEVPVFGNITESVFVDEKLEFWRGSLGLAFRF